MHFKHGFAALAGSFISLSYVAAAPALQARDDGYLYACSAWDWEGTCENIGFFNDQCTNFPQELQDDISSIGPDQGWTCQVFVDWFCNDDEGSVTIEYPGISEVTYDNDAFSSFVCTWSG